MNPYQALANAIIETAVRDYKTALKYHYTHPDKTEYTDEVKSLEGFFRSGWCEMLTDLDGEYLKNRIRAMVCKEVTA